MVLGSPFQWVCWWGVLFLVSVSVDNAQAIPVDLTVTIQPIQICNNAGVSCANPTRRLFEAAGDKIWAQAGIDLAFLPWVQFNNAAFVNPNGGQLRTLFTGSGVGEHSNPSVISMWFVHAHPGAAYGEVNTIGGNRTVISDAVFAFNMGIGRLDTISHEIGHNLGLSHPPGDPPQHLMTDGAFRAIPSSLADIFPDGAQLDQLTIAEIGTARSSNLAIPEPGTLYLVSTGLGTWLVYRGVRRSRRP
jgi:hypothetical protein